MGIENVDYDPEEDDLYGAEEDDAIEGNFRVYYRCILQI